MGEVPYDKDSRFYTLKKKLDRLLPLMLVIIVLYLYLDILASSQNILYGYKNYLQYTLLVYFVVDLGLLFTMYEENKMFFRNHWFDILLTVPFLTAFKGLKGMKVIKMGKTSKLLKPSRGLKGVKVGQKTGKLVRKTRKLLRKKLSE